MAVYKILITARSFGQDDEAVYDFLRESGCEWTKLQEKDGPIKRQLLEHMADTDALIAGLETIDASIMDAAPRLKVISRYGVGVDRVDVAAAKERGIAVTITPGANGDSVADLAVALMLGAARHIAEMDQSVRAGNQIRPQGVEMYGKTLGLVGAGRIGQGVARRCRGFKMNVLAHDIHQDREFMDETGAEYVPLDELLRRADFITIHSPLTEETRNMISGPQFRLMKRDAILVNTARGGIVDEEALYEALSTGRIRGAALDAAVKEPPYDSPLLRCQNCIFTPHAGAATKEAASKMSRMAAQNAVDILFGKGCRYRVD